MKNIEGDRLAHCLISALQILVWAVAFVNLENDESSKDDFLIGAILMSENQQGVLSRREFESTVAYKAFQVYLQSGERNVEKTSELLPQSKKVISSWAEKYDWEQRAAEIDFVQSQTQKQTMRRETQEMADLQVNLGRMLQAKGAKALKEKNLTDEPIPVILKAIELGINIERTARNIEKKNV